MHLNKLLGLSDMPAGTRWGALMQYHAELHAMCVCPANGAFPYDWERIGTGYIPAFGHWDVVHEIMDHIPVDPIFACKQIINNLYHQMPDGFLPGSIWMHKGVPDFSKVFGHPPMWIYAVEDYYKFHKSNELLIAVIPNLLRQIDWFEKNRKADGIGFYYLDILTNDWESGIDEGVRFINMQTGKRACIDATSHVYAMYACAAKWLELVGESGEVYRRKAVELGAFIRDKLYSSEEGFFYDIWAVGAPEKRVRSLEGFWPLICGVATEEQAAALIDDNLLNESRFLSKHPVPTVSLDEPCFEQRMWRGPAWNSMTYWIARGCVEYKRFDAAALILERALNATAAQFDATGTIWEFYHSQGGAQEGVQRKPESNPNIPCRDYLGHNPLRTMARLYETCVAAGVRGNPVAEAV